MNNTSTITASSLFDKVRDVIDDAILVAWDGCHKIYVAMDEQEAKSLRVDGYPHVMTSTADEMLDTLGLWWDKSCGLRFISAVGDGSFESLIAQFEEYDDED
jgi:hypothetical protein